MPALGASVTEGTILKWLKRQGDLVAKGEPLVEVMTDKVNTEIAAPEAGVVGHITAPAGETVKVGAEIGVIETKTADSPAAPAPGEGLPRRSSPLVRRLAKEHGADISLVPGSGTSGRVTKEDMLAYLAAPAARSHAPDAAGLAAPAVPARGIAPSDVASDVHDEEVLPASPLRRAIAEHMVRSVSTAPHAWTYVEADVSGLVKQREALRPEFRRREGFDLTYVPFVCKALVDTLREHPLLNSTWRADRVVLKKRIHLGVAVALDAGLVVPVLRDADEKSLAGLARALHDLVARARTGQLSPEDMQEGTFTLNNTGALGSVLSMPIIHQPQAAILTMEAIAKRVVVTADDAITVRPILNLCLSFDHRVCDGLPVGRFLQSLRQRLEAIGSSGSI